MAVLHMIVDDHIMIGGVEHLWFGGREGDAGAFTVLVHFDV